MAVRPVRVEEGGYAKGDAVRARLVQVALELFAREGYEAATTRKIADAAQVSLPAIKYYFGGKEGLYLACAEAIIDRYRAEMVDLILEVQASLEAEPTRETAVAGLKRVMGGLIRLIVEAEDAETWSAFSLRGVADNGPALDRLYEQLWAPGIELAAALISLIRGGARVSTDDRLEAMMLTSSLSGFSTMKSVTLRILRWPTVDPARSARIRGLVERYIDRLAAG